MLTSRSELIHSLIYSSDVIVILQTHFHIQRINVYFVSLTVLHTSKDVRYRVFVLSLSRLQLFNDTRYVTVFHNIWVKFRACAAQSLILLEGHFAVILMRVPLKKHMDVTSKPVFGKFLIDSSQIKLRERKFWNILLIIYLEVKNHNEKARSTEL